MANLSIVGTGYVGLVTGACLAEKGHRVTCVDLEHEKVERINRAEPPIYEPGLEALLQRQVGRNLHATTDLFGAVLATETTFICVGTPFDGQLIDLGQVEQASRAIGSALRAKDGYHTVVVKSTVVPGTTDELVTPTVAAASDRVPGRDFGVGMNPEFLREGEAVQDFMHPDRIVLGGMDSRVHERLTDVYAAFPGADLLATSNRTAEMIKYTSNSLLATLISFSNEVGNLCAALGGIDVVEVMRGVHLDRRLSPVMPDGTRVTPGLTTYLQAGCGFGGSCFPKDVNALIAHGRRAGVPMALLDAVMEVNRRQPFQILSLLRRHSGSLTGLRVAVLGLAFKPDTNDIRESPSLPVIRALLEEGAVVHAFDPVVRHLAAEWTGAGGIQLHDSAGAALEEADAVVVMTRWSEFERLPELLKGRTVQPLVVDGRRMLDPRAFQRYAGIGV